MRILNLLTVCAMLLWSGLASAGMCRPIEYAEAQDMSESALAQTYCWSAYFSTFHYDMHMKWMNLILRGGRDRQTVQWADEERRDWETCADVRAKINTARTKRGLLEAPSCEGPNAKK